MITYLLGVFVKSLFVIVVTIVRTMFNAPPFYLWTTVGTKIAAFLALDGVGAGLGLFDAFIGLDFMIWATGLALAIVVTLRLIRLIMGVFSKG